MAIFRNLGACPVECLPARTLQWQAGEAYSSGVNLACLHFAMAGRCIR